MEKIKNNTVGLIIITCNQKEITKKTLSLLQKQTLIPDIIVVDNFSNDGTKEEIEKEFPPVIVLRTKENYGSSGGQYIGTRYAYEKGYEWIIMSDNDALPVSENLIETLIDEASPMVITQPLNQIEETEINPTILLFHYGCFHRSIVERIGFPMFHLFLLHDDTEYLNRARQFFSVKKIITVKYSHPIKCGYLPSRFYFCVRNNLITARKFYPFMQKIDGFLLLINSLFIYRYIGEEDYYLFGMRAIKDFIFGRFSNDIISCQSSVFSKQCTLPVDVFRGKFESAFFNLDPYINGKLGVKYNWYNRLKSLKSLKLFFSSNVIVQGSIIQNLTLILSFFSSNIICIDEIQEKVVYYREYKIPRRIIYKLFYLVLNNIIFAWLIIFGIGKLIISSSTEDDADYIQYLSGADMLKITRQRQHQ